MHMHQYNIPFSLAWNYQGSRQLFNSIDLINIGMYLFVKWWASKTNISEQEIIKLLGVSECKYAIGHMCSASTLADVQKEHPLKLLPRLEELDQWAK